jgi:hypothetical protein
VPTRTFRPGPPSFPVAEARALKHELTGKIEGEVRFDAGSRALYAHDLAGLQRGDDVVDRAR